MRMKIAGAAVLALGTIAATAGAAEARDGCGIGGHRGFYGYCRPNIVYRPVVYRPVFYGYRRVGWYGRRWHRWGGYRHVGLHRPWGWHGGYRHVGWHGGWHQRW